MPASCCSEGLRRDTFREVISESLSEVSLALSTLLLQHTPIPGGSALVREEESYDGDTAENSLIRGARQAYTPSQWMAGPQIHQVNVSQNPASRCMFSAQAI